MSAECPRLEVNKQNCACAGTDCERHGRCCECVAYHRDRGQLPSCLKSLGR
jgi:hypothetical protein